MASRNATPFITLFLTCPRRQAIVCFKTAGIRLEDNGIDKIQVAVVAFQYIIGDCIKDIVVAIGEIAVILFFMKSQSFHFFVDFLLSGFTL